MVRTGSGKGNIGDGNKDRQQISSLEQSNSEPKQGPSRGAKVDESKKNGSGELEQILEERKAISKFQAEQRRLDGLRKIREMSSNTGIDPLSLFPKEIWLEIVNELPPADKASLWVVHPMYRGLMERNRIGEILFPQILDHKTGFVQRYFSDSKSYSDLLKLREVSKTLRDAVDKWFDDDFDNYKTVRNPFHSWTKRPFKLEMTLRESELNKILEIRRPMRLPQRDLSVKVRPRVLRDDQNVQNCFNLFEDNVAHALEQVGDQFWRFVFCCDSIYTLGVTRSRLCSLLNKWLQYLPNLQYIEIRFLYQMHINEELERRLESLLNPQHFPTLNGLKGVRFETFGFNANTLQSVFPICDAIIASNPHVQMFDFGQGGDKFDCFMSQPRIQPLELEACSFTGPDYSKILNSVAPNWNLKRMDLHELPDGSTLNTFFNFLNHFPTLEILIFDAFQITFGTDPVDFLRLPNLRHFGTVFRVIDKTEHDQDLQFFMSLQFLIHSSKLESILWLLNSHAWPTGHVRHQISFYDRKNPGTMLDFGGGFEDLSNSNLWAAFPRLERIEVKNFKTYYKKEVYRKTRSFVA